MMELVIWAMGLGLSAGGLVWLTFLNAYALHTILAAATALAIAAIAIRRAMRAEAEGLSEVARASLHASHMGAVWAWGAVAITLTYLTVLDWKEWWQFALAFAAGAAVAFGFAHRLRQAGGERLLGAARLLAGVQLAGMVATVIGLIADRKMDFEWVDWAGNNVFFFGAMALGVISLEALRKG